MKALLSVLATIFQRSCVNKLPHFYPGKGLTNWLFSRRISQSGCLYPSLFRESPIQPHTVIPVACLGLVIVILGYAQPVKAQDMSAPVAATEDAPVDFTADSLEHDETGQVITAKGNVELIQSGQILRADTVIYNLKTDNARAIGNVVLNQPNGDTYFGDDVELRDKMKDGFVNGLRGLLVDGSRFTAVQGERIAGTKTVMHDATYTPCEPCKADPSKAPVWQLVADEVTHDKEAQMISYRNARFEVAGVPVAYTPYFSHADGSVKQKSGFLTPSAGFDSQLGFNYGQQYYWAIAPDKDATFGAIVSTDVAPVLLGEYRQQFDNAHIIGEGSVTYSDRTDRSAGIDVAEDDEVRGHLFGEAQWDMNDNWRSGVRVEAASDDQYLRQYDISNEDVLENELYAERFSGRNYMVGRMLAFQDIRISERQLDQPAVLPEVIANFVGTPNGMMGGRWNIEASALSLFREGDDQDMARGTLQANWERRFVHSIGLVSVLDVTGRADAYNVSDRDVSLPGSGQDNATSEGRGFAQTNFQTSYPMVKNFGDVQMVVEPIGSITLGTNINVNNDIPNEDSQDVYLDSLKLFESNRFPGYDRIEDRSRATYGIRTGLHGANGWKGEVFLGQSHRFDKNNNPFPEGSGLSDQSSDYVGQVSADLGGYLNADYRFQLENANMSSQRHEVELQSQLGPVGLYTRYFYANAVEGSDLTESREQILGGGSFRITDDWAVNGSVRYDLGEDPGMRQATYGVDYIGQCMNVSLIGQRNLTTDSSGDSGTEFMIRVGLKNLGEFQTSGVSLGQSDD
jgi:LPS-assembly protein